MIERRTMNNQERNAVEEFLNDAAGHPGEVHIDGRDVVIQSGDMALVIKTAVVMDLEDYWEDRKINN